MYVMFYSETFNGEFRIIEFFNAGFYNRNFLPDFYIGHINVLHSPKNH